MPDVIGGIDRFRHGVQGDLLHEVLELEVLDDGEDIAIVLGLDGISRPIGDAEILDDAQERLCVLLLGRLMNPVDEGHLVLSVRLLVDHVRGDDAIGQQHELFHEAVRLEPLRRLHGPGNALVVEGDALLGEVEVDAALFLPALAQHLAHHLHQVNGGRLFVLLAVDDVLHLPVGEAVAAADHRFLNSMTVDVSEGVELHEHAVGKALDARLEAAELVGEAFGQHRQGRSHEVDRRGALPRLRIEGGALAHEVTHVGDVDAELEEPVRKLHQRNRVVEVFGRFGVDGEAGEVPQIRAGLELAAEVGLGDLLDLIDDGLRELEREPA